MREYLAFSNLSGKTLTSVVGLELYSERVIFESDSGERFIMEHLQDCCEDVRIIDIVGEVTDLIGHPILLAHESCGPYEEASESGTWTFYSLATIKGYVDIRWLGESNGYYSESVSFYKE